MNVLKEIVGVIGSIGVLYWSVRILATAVDFYRDLRTRGITRLSFWSEFEKLVKACRDSGEFPLEDPLTIDLAKASPEDRSLLSKFKNPLQALEKQLTLFFKTSGVADKMGVVRENNRLYICPTE